jgi:nucleotide-binding universal stress UspA family protein
MACDVHHLGSNWLSRRPIAKEFMPAGRAIARQELANPVVRFQNILVATDFSKGARAALDYALAIARSFQSKVFLVHAIPTVFLEYVSSEKRDEIVRLARKFAGQKMQRLVEEARCAGQASELVLSGATIWRVLEESVRENSIDLLVLGTHGQTAERKRLLGPVAEEIFRLAECPVLTVGEVKQQSSPQREIGRILLATNFKPHAEYAAPFAYALERELQARMNVLHVVEDQRELPTGGREIVSEFMITRMRKGMPSSGVGKCEPTFHVRFGEASEQIVQLASQQQSDLIVLGMRSGTGTAGTLPSAVAYKLACQAGCPVLTIRR